ncbi:hypothetical protein ACFY8S_35675 [Streptomyces hygroscopicus]|uniref:hypothetical protein n=1 Tax=Streptomyces hygroscopicus TaxID=1912 RepID=UPI0036C40DAF
MKATRRAALSQDGRLDALGRLLAGTQISTPLRVAGVIVLLYAQPLSRVVRLTVDDVLRKGDAVLLRLGEPASPVPAPVDSLVLEHIANRDNMDTATNPASRWLFPGRRAGQPFRPDHLSALLNKVGVPAAAACGAAIRQQLLEMPAPSSQTLSATTTRPPPESSERPAGRGAGTPSGWTAQSPGAGARPGSAE